MDTYVVVDCWSMRYREQLKRLDSSSNQHYIRPDAQLVMKEDPKRCVCFVQKMEKEFGSIGEDLDFTKIRKTVI